MINHIAYSDTQHPPQKTGHPEPSLGTLFAQLTEDFSTLVRKEVELARTETMETASQVARSAVSMVAGGVIAYAGLLILLLAAAFGLANVVPLWLSALIIGLITIGVGALMIVGGRNALANISLVPEKTVETLKNDARMVEEKLS
ncbi:MAG: phage holin family protein [Caldilineaceae bacterium]